MTKARGFFWIMWANIIAFTAEAFSGFVVWFVLPFSARPVVPSPMFLFDRRTWIVIHQWGAIAITAMVVLHLALHWNWALKMAKSFFKAKKEIKSAPSPATPLPVPALFRGEVPAYQAMAVKVAEGLGYLNSRQNGFVRFEKAASNNNSPALPPGEAVPSVLAPRNVQPVTANKTGNALPQSNLAVAGKPLDLPAAATNTTVQVKIVTCHNCDGKIGWRMDLGLEGNCPHCGALIRVK